MKQNLLSIGHGVSELCSVLSKAGVLIRLCEQAHFHGGKSSLLIATNQTFFVTLLRKFSKPLNQKCFD